MARACATASAALGLALTRRSPRERVVARAPVQGVREQELRRALEKAQPAMEAAFRKAAAAASKAEQQQALAVAAAAAAAEEPDGPTRPQGERQLPARSTRFAGPMDGSGRAQQQQQLQRAGSEGGAATAAAEVVVGAASGKLGAGPFARAGVLAAAQALQRLAQRASACKLPAPAGGWRTYQGRLGRLVEGEVDEAWERDLEQAGEQEEQGGGAGAMEVDGEEGGGGSLRVALAQLRLRCQELEHLLVSATGEWGQLQKLAAELAAAAGSDEDEEEDDDEEQEQQEEGEEGAAGNKRRRVSALAFRS